MMNHWESMMACEFIFLCHLFSSLGNLLSSSSEAPICYGRKTIEGERRLASFILQAFSKQNALAVHLECFIEKFKIMSLE